MAASAFVAAAALPASRSRVTRLMSSTMRLLARRGALALSSFVSRVLDEGSPKVLTRPSSPPFHPSAGAMPGEALHTQTTSQSASPPLNAVLLLTQGPCTQGHPMLT